MASIPAPFFFTLLYNSIIRRTSYSISSYIEINLCNWFSFQYSLYSTVFLALSGLMRWLLVQGAYVQKRVYRLGMISLLDVVHVYILSAGLFFLIIVVVTGPYSFYFCDFGISIVLIKI
jgi:hypothetical protein